MTMETILPTPDIFSAKRILCIQPHYDDNDIAAAGTLALLQQNGAELFYLTATDDLMGVVDHSLSDEAAAKAWTPIFMQDPDGQQFASMLDFPSMRQELFAISKL